jgi:hypothetical protein
MGPIQEGPFRDLNSSSSEAFSSGLAVVEAGRTVTAGEAAANARSARVVAPNSVRNVCGL